MKKWGRFLVLPCLAIINVPSVHAVSSTVLSLQESFVAVAEKAKPAVVNITAIHEEQGYVRSPQFFFGDPEDFLQQYFHGAPQRPQLRPYHWKTQGTGSGVIIDPKGLVLTNEHVIRGASEIKITITPLKGKGKTLIGKVVGKDFNLDLAVVKIQTPGTYPYLKLGDSSKIRVGEWAMAIGSPFELEQTVTVGVISAIRQSLLIEGRRYNNLLQTDAAINRGNSGGPLLNLDGEIIGINTAIFSPSGSSAGIGFAISINEAKEVLEDLSTGKTIRRGWLGLELAPLDEVMRRKFGLSGSEGVIVNAVLENGPASKAGLRRGDVLLEFNGVPIQTPGDLVQQVSHTSPGKKVPLTVFRYGKRKEVEVLLGERPSDAEREHSRPSLSKENQIEDRASFSWEGVELAEVKKGVLVKRVNHNSKLYGYLLENDLIQGVNQAQVSNLQDFKRLVPQLKLEEGIVFDIIREGQSMYISVQI
ncbi:MAG: trypsin-like peptidase domain-containing protein [Elusimicrobia bacterium]|nr:trypsin-like peptidase domain-containing protein [Elusimicrobiota bacterium]